MHSVPAEKEEETMLVSKEKESRMLRITARSTRKTREKHGSYGGGKSSERHRKKPRARTKGSRLLTIRALTESSLLLRQQDTTIATTSPRDHPRGGQPAQSRCGLLLTWTRSQDGGAIRGP